MDNINLKQVTLFKKALLRNIYLAVFVIVAGLIVQAHQSLIGGGREGGILLIFAAASVPLSISFLVYQAWKIVSNPKYLLFDLEAKVLKMPKSPDLSFKALSSCLLRYESGRYDLDIIYKNGKILSTGKMYVSCLDSIQVKQAIIEINTFIADA